MDADTALKTFELENNIQEVDDEKIYLYSQEEQNKETSNKPWLHDPQYYKYVKISALALVKMTMHARSGGELEVMGLLQGKVSGETMIVMDVFALPVEGTETRVNAQAEAYEYMVEYSKTVKRAGRLENQLGWYHSHPGYGCWLSGIDVGTQRLNQQFQEPFLAIVIDPWKTMSAGKVEIGAFRTYPEDYTPPNAEPSEYQSIPLDKIEDFGVHANCFYPLEISYFKSSLDSKLLGQLWNKYWISTLSSTPLLANRDYFSSRVGDIAAKCEQAESSVTTTRTGGTVDGQEKASELSKVSTDSVSVACEQINALMAQLVKYQLFSGQDADDSAYDVEDGADDDMDTEKAHASSSSSSSSSSSGDVEMSG